MAVKQKRRPRGRPPSAANDPDETRRQLLGAAAGLIAQRGYSATTVNEIVARSGLSKGTFYWHFKSKDDVLFAVLEEHVDRPLYELIELLEGAPAERDMAPEASRRLLDWLERGRETILLEQEYRLLAIREPGIRARYRKRQRALREALAAGLDARAKHLGAPPFDMPASDVAAAYLALGTGLAVEGLIDPKMLPADLLGDIAALVYRGLVARAQQRASETAA
jgi:AcrR family transcriptional regulator